MSCRRVSGKRGGRGEFEAVASDGVHKYIVAVAEGDQLLCPCDGFTYRRACRHAANASAQLRVERGLPPQVAVAAAAIAPTPVRSPWREPMVEDDLTWITAYAASA